MKPRDRADLNAQIAPATTKASAPRMRAVVPLRLSSRLGREELLFEFGAKPTLREKRLTEITVAGAALNLGAWTAGADRPTEMAIAFSAQALYDELPKPLRQSLGNVPALVAQLEQQARAMREQMAALDESIASARAGRASVQVGELQESVVADLTAARIRASEHLADLLAALEATRLDLLRLRAGQGTADQITHTMAAATALGDDVARLLSARAEIDAALRLSPRPLGAERTPA